jgi:hypothetical protein
MRRCLTPLTTKEAMLLEALKGAQAHLQNVGFGDECPDGLPEQISAAITKAAPTETGHHWTGKAEPGRPVNQFYDHLHDANNSLVAGVTLPTEEHPVGTIIIHEKGGKYPSSRIWVYAPAMLNVMELLHVGADYFYTGRLLLSMPARLPKLKGTDDDA